MSRITNMDIKIEVIWLKATPERKYRFRYERNNSGDLNLYGEFISGEHWTQDHLHFSYHSSGEVHVKMGRRGMMPLKRRQPLDETFKGFEDLHPELGIQLDFVAKNPPDNQPLQAPATIQLLLDGPDFAVPHAQVHSFIIQSNRNDLVAGITKDYVTHKLAKDFSPWLLICIRPKNR